MKCKYKGEQYCKVFKQNCNFEKKNNNKIKFSEKFKRNRSKKLDMSKNVSAVFFENNE